MKTSENGKELIRQREGVRLTVYRDSKGLPTAGVGHLLVGEEKRKFPVGAKISQGQADEWLRQDLSDAEDVINTSVGAALSQNEFDALVSFVFNIGVNGFQRSTVLKLLNVGDKKGAASALMNWVKPPELRGRRESEQRQFLTPYSGSVKKVSAAASAPAVKTSGNDSPTPAKTPPASAAAPPELQANMPQPSAQAVAVTTVAAEPQASPFDTTLNRWSARIVAVPTIVFSFLGGAFAWLRDSPANLVIALIASGAAVAICYIVGRQIVTGLREAREARIQRERENRAHQTQLALIDSAASTNKNTVVLVPPPPAVELKNSDAEPLTFDNQV